MVAKTKKRAKTRQSAPKKAAELERKYGEPIRKPADLVEAEAGEYMTRAEALAALGISPRTLERLATEGKLTRYTRIATPGRRGRRAVFYKRAEVEALQTIAPAPSGKAEGNS